MDNKELKKKILDNICKYEYVMVIAIVILIVVLLIYGYIGLEEKISKKEIYSIQIGFFGSLILSALQYLLLKIYTKNIFDKEQLEYVNKLNSFYLTNLKIEIKKIALRYVKAFRDSQRLPIEFKAVENNNQINIDNLVYNFTIIQYLKENAFELIKKTSFNNLRIVNVLNSYDNDYFSACEKAEELKEIYKNGNLKYKYPLFSEEEISSINFFGSPTYYFEYSKSKEKEKERKFDRSERQLIVNEFERLNNIIKIFDINFYEESTTYTKSELNEVIEKITTENKRYDKIQEEALFEVKKIFTVKE